jgi:hypothetical protein
LARSAQAFQVAVFVAWSYPGLYDLAVHVLHVKGQLTLPGGWHLERAHLYPLGVDGGIVTAFVLLLSDRGQLARAHRRELWLGMWACAGLSAVGLVVDAVKAGAGWAAPLVVIPVALGTWFLHMVVERQAPAVRTSRLAAATEAYAWVPHPLPARPAPLPATALATAPRSLSVVPPEPVPPVAPVAAPPSRVVAAVAPGRSQVTVQVPFKRREKGACVAGCDRHGSGTVVSYDTYVRCAERVATPVPIDGGDK